MKTAWQHLKENWHDMNFFQRAGWILFFPLLFPLLALACYFNNKVVRL